MRALNNVDFLTLWENGHRLHPLDRALLAIRASLPEGSRDSNGSPADWPLGRRNRALAQLRTLYFGPKLQGWMSCTQCGEKLEFEVDCRTLANTPEPAAGRQISVSGNTFRLPTSRDLALIASEHNPDKAALHLLQNCVIPSPDAVTPATWSDTTVEEVAQQMALADPLAEISLGFECPVCQHTSEEILDLPSFLWTEIESRARRLLLEIHALATAYGWAESAILAMTDIRRATYLQMVNA
jgi:hypothetical protein